MGLQMNNSCDVLVIGGGVSGVTAAVASARSGVKTVLAEKENYLGGTGYAGLLQHICGLYLNGDTLPTDALNDGIVREIVGILNNLSPQKTIKKIGQVYILPYLREDLLTAFTSLCDKEPNLTVLFNTTAVSAKKKGQKIVKITLNQSGSLQKITPKIVIDCSGDGDVSAMAGADFELSPLSKRQLAGFIIRIKGLKDCDETLPIKVPYYLSKATEQKLLPSYLKFTTFTQGESLDEGFCKINIPTENSKHKQAVLKNAIKAIRYLANKLPTFKDAYIVETSLRVLNREGRKICGEYTLTEEDVLKAAKFTDGVVKNSWPIELWYKDRGTIYKYVPTGYYYEIPFRCMKVKGIINLLCAGRCISVSHEALGSTRVMGTCMALGEQTGRAAASYAMHGVYLEQSKNRSGKP